MKGNWVTIDKKSGSGSGGQSLTNKGSGNTSNYPTSSTQGGGYSTSGTSSGSYSVGSYNSTFLSSYSGYGNSQGLGKLYEPEEVLGMSGHTKKNPYGDSETIDQIIEYCKKKSGDCWGSNGILCGGGKGYMKAINLSRTDMHDNDCGNLFYTLRNYNFNLEVLNLSNNRIGDLGVESMIYGITSLQYQTLYSAENGWKPYQSNLKTVQNVITINLSNNQIGDKGAYILADHLAKGNLPSTKSIDVSGNHITKTGTGYFIDALKNSTVGNIIIKQYHLSVFGNKESKVAFMKDYLKQAQDKGVDVKNIAVDKSLFGYIKNTGKVCKDTVVGFAKCYYVDDVATDYVANKIIARASKSLSALWNAKDVVNCYAETFDDVMTSPEGVQLIKTDLEVMGESSVINAIE